MEESFFLAYYGIVALVALLMFYYLYQSKKGKVHVRIKTQVQELTHWVTPESDGETIIIRERGKEPWRFKFSNRSLIPKRGPFGNYFAIDVFPLAPKAIDYDYTIPAADQPKWDRDVSTRFIKAQVLKQYGKGEEKEKGIELIILILVIASIAVTVITKFMR